MGVPVNHQIDRVVVDHPTQLRVAEHPPLRRGLRAERRRRWRKVGNDDAQRCVECPNCSVEPLRLSPNFDRDRSKNATVRSRGVLLPPKPTARPGDARDPDVIASTDVDDDRFTVEDSDAFAL